MKILITGSSGSIGTRLQERLLEKGYDFLGFDIKDNKWKKDFKAIKGDLLRKEDIKKISTNIDLIIHLAANARLYDLVLNPEKALENIIMTFNVLEYARKNNIKKIIFSSSREVYGNKEAILKEEEVGIDFCESPYSASKVSCETIIQTYSKCYGIDYVILRFSNVYGMYDENDRFVPSMIKKMRRNEKAVIFGEKKFLDFTYIDDCVLGIIKAIEKFPKNNIINITGGVGGSLIQVADLIKDNLNSISKIEVKENRKGEVERYVADISKAKRLLDYNPSYSIEKGIKLTIDWYKNNVY